MSLSLQHIYNETKGLFRLELLCGNQGLDRRMTWVYISEDISTGDFLRGGELIITTGVSKEKSPDWLRDFIAELIRRNTCGLILNVGKYLTAEDVTPEIRQMCEEAGYPLFSMPWHIHIYDITRNYYNRIFIETQNENAVSEAFLDYLHGYNREHSLSVLSRYGYFPGEPYALCFITGEFPAPDSPPSGSLSTLSLHLLRQYARELRINCHFCQTEHSFLMVAPLALSDMDTFSLAAGKITEMLCSRFPELKIHSGMGSLAQSLSDLPRSFLHAKAAARMAQYRELSFFTFREMGFFKLILASDDTRILHEYVRENLGTVLDYDELHHSDYTETLRQYLLHDGSVQKIAASLFCHRNTVNYRIRILKETLQLPLEYASDRFELLAAFYVMDFLQILSGKE